MKNFFDKWDRSAGAGSGAVWKLDVWLRVIIYTLRAGAGAGTESHGKRTGAVGLRLWLKERTKVRVRKWRRL